VRLLSRWAVVLCATAWIGGPALARAQPQVHFAVRSSCPSEAELVHALGGQVIPAPSDLAAWSIEVENAGPDGATLILRTPEGEVSAQRTIASYDCGALAQAFALIVLAQFAEIHLLPTVVGPSAAPGARAGHTTDGRTAPRSKARSTLALDIAALAGVELGLAPFSVAPAGGLALGLGTQQTGWLARFDARVSGAVRDASRRDRIERWTSSARLELGGRLRFGRGWFASTAGGGVSLAHVTALDLDGRPAALRIWPALSLTALLGFGLGAGWSLRLQTAASLFPRVDRYVVQPDGVVATSPRAELAAGVGLEFALPL
jgi:hypothetical protein